MKAVKTNEIINRIKQVLEDYKERAVIDCKGCEKEDSHSIQRCIDKEGEKPDNCLKCEARERELKDFYTEAEAFLDLMSNVVSCLPISPRGIQTDKYPFKAVSFRDGSFELVNVQGYSATVGWVVELKQKIDGNTCYFLREIFPLSES